MQESFSPTNYLPASDAGGCAGVKGCSPSGQQGEKEVLSCTAVKERSVLTELDQN